MQQLWELINAQQIVILLPLFKVSIPGNAMIFFEQLMTIAALEVIPTDVIYENFSVEEPQPLSLAFEQVGLEHHLVMNNFGTLGFIFSILPAFYVL